MTSLGSVCGQAIEDHPPGPQARVHGQHADREGHHEVLRRVQHQKVLPGTRRQVAARHLRRLRLGPRRSTGLLKRLQSPLAVASYTTVKASNFGPCVNFGLFLRRASYNQNASYRKVEKMKVVEEV